MKDRSDARTGECFPQDADDGENFMQFQPDEKGTWGVGQATVSDGMPEEYVGMWSKGKEGVKKEKI